MYSCMPRVTLCGPCAAALPLTRATTHTSTEVYTKHMQHKTLSQNKTYTCILQPINTKYGDPAPDGDHKKSNRANNLPPSPSPALESAHLTRHSQTRISPPRALAHSVAPRDRLCSCSPLLHTKPQRLQSRAIIYIEQTRRANIVGSLPDLTLSAPKHTPAAGRHPA